MRNANIGATAPQAGEEERGWRSLRVVSFSSCMGSCLGSWWTYVPWGADPAGKGGACSVWGHLISMGEPRRSYLCTQHCAEQRWRNQSGREDKPALIRGAPLLLPALLPAFNQIPSTADQAIPVCIPDTSFGLFCSARLVLSEHRALPGQTKLGGKMREAGK